MSAPQNYLKRCRDDGATGFWWLKERAGSVASDSIGANNATWTSADSKNAKYVMPSIWYPCAGFSGSGGDTITGTLADTAIDPQLDFSAEAWINTDSAIITGFAFIIRKDVSNNCSMRVVNGRIDFRMIVAGTGYGVQGISIDANTHHIVYTLTAAGVRALYVDGAPISITNITTGSSRTDGTFAIGEQNANFYWDGRVQGVAIYHVALSAAQVLKHYQAGHRFVMRHRPPRGFRSPSLLRNR